MTSVGQSDGGTQQRLRWSEGAALLSGLLRVTGMLVLVRDIVLLSDVILNAVSAKIVIHFLTTIHYVREVSSLIHIQSDFKCIID